MAIAFLGRAAWPGHKSRLRVLASGQLKAMASG